MSNISETHLREPIFEIYRTMTSSWYKLRIELLRNAKKMVQLLTLIFRFSIFVLYFRGYDYLLIQRFNLSVLVTATETSFFLSPPVF